MRTLCVGFVWMTVRAGLSLDKMSEAYDCCRFYMYISLQNHIPKNKNVMYFPDTCNTLHNTSATQLNEYMRNFCKGLVITFKWVSRVTDKLNQRCHIIGQSDRDPKT